MGSSILTGQFTVSIVFSILVATTVSPKKTRHLRHHWVEEMA